ncbi:MAG: HEAT repeat domain-containing protein [Anaerolineaceae bacterium]|jgi:HEAT repeat protein|nr:HEAT repeat domain-containing protein [Anaerolineaceae bacterium]
MPFFQKNYSSDKISELENQGDARELSKVLRHKDPDMRLKAAAALGRVGGAAAVQVLIETLESDPMGSVRFFAADSLGKIAGKEAIAPLTRALDNHKENVHQAAAQALGEIADRLRNPILFDAATQKLVPLLRADHEVREAVITALGKIRDPRAVQAIANLMAKTFSKQEIRLAAEALIRIGRPAVSPLRQILAQAEDLSAIAAALALGRIGDPGAVPSLIQALHHRHDEVRRQAAMALGKMKALAAVPHLLAVLEDNDAPVRVAVANALGEMHAREAVETLQSLATYDFQASVRAAAEAALNKIG